MIELYGCGSPNVLKLVYMLAETGLPWRLQPVNVAGGAQFEPAFLALNPNAKVPVLVDPHGPGGQPHTVFESGAILLYLAEKTGLLLPRDPAARSRAVQWLMFQMAGVGPMFGQALHFMYIAPSDNIYARSRYATEVQRLYGVLDGQLANTRWLAGGECSIADVAAYPWVGKYAKTLGVDLSTRKHVARWLGEFEARPAIAAIDPYAKSLFKDQLAAQKAATPEQLDRFFGREKFARGEEQPEATPAGNRPQDRAEA